MIKRTEIENFTAFFHFLLILLFFTFPCQSQTNVDSIQKIWSNEKLQPQKRFAAYESYFLLLIESNPKAILQSSISHLQLAKKEESKKEILLALGNRSNAQSLLGKSDEALKTLEVAFKYAKKFKDSISMASNLGNRGANYYSKGNYKEAVRFYLKSLVAFREMKMVDREAILLNNLGNVFDVIEDHKQALYYFEKSLGILKKLGKEDQSEHIWTSLSNTAIQVNKIDEGLKYNQKAFAILQKNNNKFGLAECYYLFSIISSAKKQNSEALAYAKRSLDISMETEGESQILKYKVVIGKLLLDQNVTEATKIGEEALGLIQENTLNEVLVELYDLLYKCYKKQNKTNRSLEMLEKYNFHNERLIKQKKDFDIIREAIQSEFADDLRYSEMKNAASMQALRQKQNYKILFLISTTLVVFGVLFVYYRKRMTSSRQERDRLLEEIENIKSKKNNSAIAASTGGFQLDREKIENALGRKMNETDWKVLNILFEDPVISNQEIAEKAFMSAEGIGSSLRRMYGYFEIKESKYKKISLLLETVRISNQQIYS